MNPIYLIKIGIFFLTLIFLAEEAAAVTISASRTTAYPNEPIAFTATVTINGMAGTPPSATLVFDFGDGTTTPNIFINAVNGTSETHSRTHSFAAPGTYRVRAIGTAIAGYTVVPPTIAAVTITILPGISAPTPGILPGLNAPPSGIVAEPYSHSLAGSPEARRYSYSVVGGRMVPGLELQRNGTITGTPLEKGIFAFTLRISLPGGGSFTEETSITIRPGNLKIVTSPANIEITRGPSSRQVVTFSVTQPRIPLPETIVSGRGEFLVNGRTVAGNPTPLSIDLNRNRPTATEHISIPAAVAKAAQDSSTGIVQYRRTFDSANFNSTVGQLDVMLRTAATGNLRIHAMRIYFEQNNRPIIVVPRLEQNLRGKIDINYSGSGSFRGYWQVDKRIIQRVQRNLYYGKTLTLTTPEVPRLPTFSEGSHRVQFIITEPESAQQVIDFPVAIYHVEAKQSERLDTLEQISPAPRASITPLGETFSWSGSARAVTYQLDFYTGEAEEPFFKAFTKENRYHLNETVLALKFAPGEQYHWQVRALDEQGEPIGESGRRALSLVEPQAFVPGEILFLVERNDAGARLIREIVEKYRLELIEQTEFSSVDRILVLCRTTGDVHLILSEIRQEQGILISQPNYVFSTMRGRDPLRSMQSMNTLLDLDLLHGLTTGKDVVVAVIDTGIDLDHADLMGQVLHHRNFVADSPYSGEIHGTAVAGIIAGAENDFGILGVAPQAKLLALRACAQIAMDKPEGRCLSSAIAEALDAAIVDQADIVNLSFGSFVQDDLIALLLDDGAGRGMVFIAPVGNDPQADDITFPASHPKVIAVAGFDANSGPLPNRKLATLADAVAPGSDFFSTAPHGKHNFFSGTSFSAAAIAGITALSLQNNTTQLDREYPGFTDVATWKNTVEKYLGAR